MQGNIGREQGVIPFQTPSLGKIAYEHQLRNQQKQEREDYRREQRAENLTSGIYGGMLKLNEGQRQQAQPLYDEIIELATRYEQGEDVYNELRQKTEMFKAAMNGAVGLNSAWSEKAALYEQDPSRFQDDETAWNDKRNMYSNGLGSFYDYADVTKSKELFVNTTPQEKRALSKWMTPNELVQFNWLQTSKEFSKENRQLLPSGDYRVTSTIDAEKAKPEIVSQLRTYANDPDALSGMVTFYLGRAATPEEVADIAKNENSLNDVLDKYADVVIRTQQAKQQERGYNINMPSPTQPKGYSVNFGGNKYNTGKVGVDYTILRNKNTKEVTGEKATFTNMPTELFNIDGKQMPVQISQIEYDPLTDKYIAKGFGYKTSQKQATEGGAQLITAQTKGEAQPIEFTEATEPVTFEITVADLPKINRIANDAPIMEILKNQAIRNRVNWEKKSGKRTSMTTQESQTTQPQQEEKEKIDW